MPADVQIIVACIIAAFAAFMITLAGTLLWTWSGDHKQVEGRSAQAQNRTEHHRAA